MAISFWGPGSIISSVIYGQNNQSTVAALPNGGYVVAWREGGSSSATTFFQLLDAAGNRIGEKQSVGNAGYAQSRPDITVLRDGSFVLTWTGQESNGDIESRKYSITGTPLTNVLKSASGTPAQDYSASATSGTGWASVWQEEAGVKMVRRDANGGLLQSVTVSGASGAQEPDITELTGGQHVVAWSRSGKSYFNIVNANGTLAGEVEVASSGADVSLTTLSDGNFAVSYRSGGQILVKKYTSAGTQIGSAVSVTTASDYAPKIAALTKSGFAGGYAVVYSGKVYDANNKVIDNGDVFLKLVKADGTELAPVMINDTSKDNTVQQDIVGVSELADGRIVVTWDDGTTGAGAIRQQIVDAREQAVTVNGSIYDDFYVGTAFAGDVLNGAEGNDRLYGGEGGDILDGGAGTFDTASFEFATAGVVASLATGTGTGGEAAGDTYVNIENLLGSNYGDSLEGDANANYLWGSGGNDTLNGGAGIDTLDGGAGDDVYYINDGDVVAESAGNGYDIVYASVNFSLEANANVEQVIAAGSNAVTLTGSSSANVFTGNGAANTFNGLGGDDTYYVGAGDTVVEGIGQGYDRVYSDLSYALSAGAEVEELNALGSAAITLTGSDTNNRINGNAAANTLYGMGGNDAVYGFGGKDQLFGGTGNDTIYGGADNDTLTGNAGKDVFVFDSKPNKKTNVDKVTDFSVKDDSIYLENAIFKGLGKKGTPTKPAKLSSAAFWSGTSAHDADDRIIYDKKSGALYYDADGIGGVAQIKIATLKKGLAMTYKDFFVI
ncbi:calcium-binding protein [Microvirga flavescens]|uniref:calcium-binding protein n=1 Tax=Microvirga flavescens TaxID=2249811 RepID=UPI000DDB1AE2|nr:calcium-binding protein [Microvirga flavescens]